MSNTTPITTFVEISDVLNQCLQSKEDRIDLFKDANQIQNSIMCSVKNRDPKLQNIFRGVSLTGSYLDNLKLHLPDKFSYHAKLELDLKLTVIKDSENNGFVYLHSIENGFVDRLLLQAWLRDIFAPVLEELKEIRCSSNNIYMLKYKQQGNGCVHTISAIDKRDVRRTILFEFLPAFKFPSNVFPHFENAPQHLRPMGEYWFVVPQDKEPADGRKFIIYEPHWERQVIHNKNKQAEVLRFKKAARNTRNRSHFTKDMLKSVFLLALTEKNEKFWKRTKTVIFAQMLRNFIFDHNDLLSYLSSKLKHFDRLSKSEITRLHLKVLDMLLNVQYLTACVNEGKYEDLVSGF